MGAVNRVSPRPPRAEAIWLARPIITKSPTAIRMLKFAFNVDDDGMVGQQVFAGEATRLAYRTDEAVEGRDAFLERREPDWGPYPWHFWPPTPRPMKPRDCRCEAPRVPA